VHSHKMWAHTLADALDEIRIDLTVFNGVRWLVTYSKGDKLHFEYAPSLKGWKHANTNAWSYAWRHQQVIKYVSII
jgi:hypothetical protein